MGARIVASVCQRNVCLVGRSGSCGKERLVLHALQAASRTSLLFGDVCNESVDLQYVFIHSRITAEAELEAFFCLLLRQTLQRPHRNQRSGLIQMDRVRNIDKEHSLTIRLNSKM